MNKYFLLGLIFMLVFSGCTEHDDIRQTMGNSNTFRIQAAHFSVSGANTSLPDENQIRELDAYLFDEGKLIKKYEDLARQDVNEYSIEVPGNKGTLYFLGNSDAITDPSFIQSGMNEEDFLQLTTLPSVSSASDFLSGRLDLSGTSTSQQVSLRHGVARIDLALQDAETTVKSISIKHVAQMGYLFGQDPIKTAAGTEFEDINLQFEPQLDASKSGLLYLHEQANDQLAVSIIVSRDGKESVLKAQLPEAVKRNAVYTIRIFGNNAAIEAEIKIDEWNDGEDQELYPDLSSRILVNPDLSTFSEGVILAESLDAIQVPYQASRMTLVLNAPSEVDLQLKDPNLGITVEAVPDTINKFIITTCLNPIGHTEKSTALGIKYKILEQSYEDKIDLTLQKNDIEMEGSLAFDLHRLCDYGKYLDGELARFTLTGGKQIQTEGIWLKTVTDDSQPEQVRLLAGWKPNDPEADGRVQEGKLKILSESGETLEEYTIRRRNYGLPVVNVDGTWWCKYNLQGNVKRFEDQISIQDDPAKDVSLYDYLTTCSDEEWLAIWGDSYQGDNPNGLKLRHNGTSFYYEGFNQNNAVFIGNLPVTEMAPDGYQLPGDEEFTKFKMDHVTSSTDINFGNGATNGYWTQARKRINIKNYERANLEINGISYGPVHHHSVKIESANSTELILFGPGAQTYGDGSDMFESLYIIWASHFNDGFTWLMEGYATSTGRGNWFKTATYPARCTRVIRCVKTPVEYIYN